eukprot:CAMPEP_0206623524 /NCGR_PEP_ID=MMETSP0325_2-20121206/63527_1 /ASSEMBLY_ACC=CAM_ASM_000347 /TAXON_ID=2866 /ORGANISM="Crypthecodinium cohnii, Strain Seligo" /LENGTH=171 /DNA_ID=CAMNT_0054147205 /DNA_START=172 /DNA_END=690 /DNA_ORIENTATION=+
MEDRPDLAAPAAEEALTLSFIEAAVFLAFSARSAVPARASTAAEEAASLARSGNSDVRTFSAAWLKLDRAVWAALPAALPAASNALLLVAMAFSPNSLVLAFSEKPRNFSAALVLPSTAAIAAIPATAPAVVFMLENLSVWGSGKNSTADEPPRRGGDDDEGDCRSAGSNP